MCIADIRTSFRLWVKMYVKIVIISLLAIVVQHGFKLYTFLDFGKKVYNHYPGPCHQVEGIDYGSENMFMLSNGVVFITSGFSFSEKSPPNYQEFYAKHKIKGRIYMFDMKNPKKTAVEMSMSSSKEFDRDGFFPHGISGWQDQTTGKLYLFVVNHDKSGVEKVEKFLVSMETQSLTHVKTFTGDGLFSTLNDVAATGPDSFYFTNSLSSTSYFGRMLEILLFLPWSNVGYYDGSSSRQVLGGFLVNNGIDISKDGRYIYLIAGNSRELYIYNRNKDDSLSMSESFKFGSGPDNVLVDPNSGDLYIGLHPINHRVLAHLDDPEERSPSQVLHIKLQNGSVSSVTQLFADDGNLLTASTGAVVYKKKMLIGSIIDKLVYCDIDVPF